MKILVAQDGSEVSLRALRSLMAQLAWYREPPELHLLFVHPPIPIALATQHVDRAALDAYYREEGEQALAGARAELDAAGLAYTPHLHVGPVAECIVKRARELGCHLICMGTHGRGALGNVLVGSTVAKVLHLSPLPVLLDK
jgi:nucleotide-binding universal stress UspA family protein